MLKTDGQRAMARTLQDVANGTLYSLEYDQSYLIDALMANGGASSSAELLSYILPRLLNMPSQSASCNADFGCSAFCVRSPEGDVLVGRNFDYRFASASNMLVHDVLPGVHKS